jgi:hypothetical protein
MIRQENPDGLIDYLWHLSKKEGRDLVTLGEITERGAIVADKNGTRSEIYRNTMVLSLGVRSPLMN